MSWPRNALILSFFITVLSGWISMPLWAEEPRDPFVFGRRQAAFVDAQPVLTGILWDATNPLVMVDGEPMTIGQQVSGWTMTQVGPDHVVIERDGQQQTLSPGNPFPAN